MKVLVCWNEIPEDMNFVVLDVDAATAKTLRSFHNHFVNGGDTPEGVSDAIYKYFYDDKGGFKFTKIDTPVELEGISFAVQTGFVL